MKTPMPARREIIAVLTEMSLWEQSLVRVGEGLVTRDWGDETGADGHDQPASQAVKTAKRLVLRKRMELDSL